MAFLKSKKVKVFPCGGRAKQYDPLARLTTEYNLVSLINRLVDKNSFIVTSHNNGEDISNKTDDYIINIDGYLFTIEGGAKPITESCSAQSGTYIIAYINVQSYFGVDDNTYYQQLGPIEEIPITPGVNPNNIYNDGILDSSEDETTSEFKSISFTCHSTYIIEGIPESHQLTLFKKVNGSWVEYEDSKIKFHTDTYGKNRSVKIDDGIL